MSDIIVYLEVNEKWELDYEFFKTRDKKEIINRLFDILPHGKIEDKGDTVYIYPYDGSSVWWIVFNLNKEVQT